ncbi:MULTISPECIES: hypothetical protein [Planococcus]|uniref:Uncharacterized protein n=1 Tax=Planococcus wigleyi TaxID=2762216 RepID=A0ABR8WBZ8_9BACL|nr:MULTISPECIES: hypothetical protein [Planococcus]MBD8014539.1 hypothetical protein [Planococcus wigleyi]MBF6634765.1 hypothetical protein [Planococcus sp. (in: firmicutes)]
MLLRLDEVDDSPKRFSTAIQLGGEPACRKDAGEEFGRQGCKGAGAGKVNKFRLSQPSAFQSVRETV